MGKILPGGVAALALTASAHAAAPLSPTLVCAFPEFDLRFDGNLMQANAGIAQVQVFEGWESRTYIEWTGSGIPQVTVVAHDGTAVHSRHSLIFGQFVESQQRGTCRPWVAEQQMANRANAK